MTDDEDDVIRIVHMSDLHFTDDTDIEDVNGVWLQLVSYFKTLKPDFMVITGDIANTPSKNAFAKAKKALNALVGDDYNIRSGCPGNHDRFILGNRVRSVKRNTFEAGMQHTSTAYLAMYS